MKNFAILFSFLFGAMLLSSCLNLADDDFSSRDVNVVAGSISPGTSYVATSYSMMGGGAAGWCYMKVNVRKQSEQFNPDSGVVFQTRCSVEPKVSWKNDASLSIAYPRDATVYSLEKTRGGVEAVEVSYAPQ